MENQSHYIGECYIMPQPLYTYIYIHYHLCFFLVYYVRCCSTYLSFLLVETVIFFELTIESSIYECFWLSGIKTYIGYSYLSYSTCLSSCYSMLKRAHLTYLPTIIILCCIVYLISAYDTVRFPYCHIRLSGVLYNSGLCLTKYLSYMLTVYNT